MGKITAVALKALLKKPGRHADGEGLYLRVVGDNKVYWVFRYTLKGAAREMALGPHPELGLTEARDKLRDLRKQVKVEKRDVLIERTTAIVPSEKPTFAKAAADFISLKQTKWKGENRRAILEALLRIYCGPINSKPVDQVTSDDIVMKVLSPIWAKHPVTAVRLRGLIEQTLNAARVLGHIDADKANPARWTGHLEHVLPKPTELTRGHQRSLAYQEVPALVARLRTLQTRPRRSGALALELVILTATRTNEVLGMQWKEVGFDTRTWVVPASRMKTSKPFRVPLSDRAMAILDEARRMSAKEPTGDSFVFMGAVQKATQGGPPKPLSGMSLAMMLRRLDPDITVHGFRTSFRNWCSEEAEIEFAVAETSLSHLVGSKASRAYARSDLLERRRPLMESWSRYVGGVAKSNVLPLTRAMRG